MIEEVFWFITFILKLFLQKTNYFKIVSETLLFIISPLKNVSLYLLFINVKYLRIRHFNNFELEKNGQFSSIPSRDFHCIKCGLSFWFFNFFSRNIGFSELFQQDRFSAERDSRVNVRMYFFSY